MRLKISVKFDERAFREALKKKFKEAGERRAQRAGRLLCPVHHKAPSIRTTLRSDGKIHYEVTGCCAKVRKLAIADLSKA